MKPVLLRCVDSGTFILPDGRLLDTAGLVAAREELLTAVRGTKPSQGSEIVDCTLAIPAQKCLLAQVPVSRQEVRMLRKTLPWTLEESLLEPAESAHFAIGKIMEDMALICVINKSWFAAVLSDLALAGIRPGVVVPEILLVPWQPGQWSLLIENRNGAVFTCLIRFGECDGLVCNLDNLQFILQARLNEKAETPESIVLFANAETSSVVRENLPSLLQARIRTSPPAIWSKIDVPSTGMNLLQEEFAPRIPWQRWCKEWRMVGMLTAALLVTDIVATVLQTAKVERARAAVEADIVELFQSVQPDAVIVDPQLQLERAVATLGGGKQVGLTKLLDSMAPALESLIAVEVQNLDYSSSTGELQMTIVSDSFAAAETLRADLQSLGLDAELLGSSSEGTRNRSRLRVGGS
jgi:general secretion pathway protein L